MTEKTHPDFALRVQGVSHWFGSNLVLQNINLDVAAGQIVAVVGPSGCGKSTLLKAILGTQPPKKGTIHAGGKRIVSPRRDIGIVFQDYALYDFLTAEENVAFGLKLDETSFWNRFFALPSYLRKRKEQLSKAREFLTRVGLGEACGQYPHELSGGMRQRVAIAQAFILKPSIVLLDEPFGALDETTREDLQSMLLHFYQQNLVAKQEGRMPEYTILMVTHELNEAIYVADRVVGLSQFHETGSEGATIVYDKECPVFHPDDPKDLERLVTQREELRRAVFDDSYVQHHSEYVSFCHEIQDMAKN
jgi:NitT/TauT family transport system ATP-binding protein